MRTKHAMSTMVALVLIVAGAWFLRVYFAHEHVFRDGIVAFQGADSWYHARLMDNTSQHFPSVTRFDPYLAYPEGQSPPVAPLFNVLLTGFVLLMSLGQPAAETADRWAAHFPALLGALIPLPVYGIGRLVFGRLAGLLAAATVAVLPGQFLWRSQLGTPDHHVLEGLLSTCVVLALLHATRPDDPASNSGARRRLLFSLLAGFGLGCYLLSWVGGALLVGILTTWAGMQFVVDHLRGRSTLPLLTATGPAFAVALAMVLPFGGRYFLWGMQRDALLVGLAAVLLLGGVSALFRKRELSSRSFAIAVSALGLIGLTGMRLLAPGLLGNLPLRSGGGDVMEVAPLLFHAGQLRLDYAWQEFTTGIVLIPLALGVLIVSELRRTRPGVLLVLVWSGFMLVLTLAQNRYAYYFAINAALLLGYLCCRVYENYIRAEDARGRGRWLAPIGGLVAFAVIVLDPNLIAGIRETTGLTGPSKPWIEALEWMREETPEPFDDGDAYVRAFPVPGGGGFPYPERAYGVLAWWDYGYWIARIARRPVHALPTQGGAGEVARFFTTDDPLEAAQILDRLDTGYVVVDDDLPYRNLTEDGSRVGGKFDALARWAGRDIERYREPYFVVDEQGRRSQQIVFYPAYYRSMVARLSTFGGDVVEPRGSSYAIGWTERMDADGSTFRVVTDVRQFETYDEAQAFVDAPHEGDYVLGGLDPMTSCVPIDPLPGFERVYANGDDGESMPAVSVFSVR
ncbi:MAG: oligosaccharyl transferase, archaeosortase A system-associated [bacterium]|nr:oligosaccharyl transferase, archaeosortase A system-associated [bacterium]